MKYKIPTYKENKTLWIALGLTIAYLFAVAFIAGYHEPWMDEAQAWLVARDLGVFGIIDQMSYEGSGPLWHFLLFPFAKLGLPYVTMTILHVGIATIAVYVFLRYAPYTWLMKILVLGSFFFAFEYVVVARSYALSVLFIFLIAALWKQRFDRPIIFAVFVALLAQTNSHSFCIAGAIGLIYLWDAWKQKRTRELATPLAIMAISGLSVILMAWPEAGHYTELLEKPEGVRSTIMSFLTSTDRLFFPPLTNYAPPIIFFLFFAALLRYPRQFFIMLASVSGMMYIFLERSPGGGAPRHWGLILVLILFAYWTAQTETPVKTFSKNTGLIAWLTGPKGWAAALVILQFMFFLFWYETNYFWGAEMQYPFSNSKAMAEYIEKNIPNEPIAAYNAGRTMPILPYFADKEFYYVQFERWGTFQTKSSDYGPDAYLESEAMRERLDNAFGDDLPYLLLTQPLPEDTDIGYEEVYRIEATTIIPNGEVYYLYQPI